MTELTRTLPSFLVSLVIHTIVILTLLLIPVVVPSLVPETMLESMFLEDVAQEQIIRDLDLRTDPAESLNVISGGTLATTVGAAAQPSAAPLNIQEAKVMKEANLRPVLTDLPLPTDDAIATELGEGEITGEVGAMVDGYGAAMGIITQEIIRMMRHQKVTVIWMFDESESMVDDRREIRENYLRVYEELGIAAAQDENLRRGSELLLTVVAGFGEQVHELTPRPTADKVEIREAIDRIPVDPTGKENMCQSLAQIVNVCRKDALRGKRKLAVIVVTDESGDDGEFVEDALAAARSASAPVYFMSRESTFGYPYARQRWIDKPTGEEFWLTIRRGPESEFPECLQWNGLHERWDVQSSGFGSYEQVRIAKETGGIFFVLPGEEETLVGEGANDRRKYDFLAMREYQPLLLSRQEYLRERASSHFRETIWQRIARLNPSENKLLFQVHDPELVIRRDLYPLPPDQFRAEAASQVVRAAKAMLLTEEAIGLLERVRPLRAAEPSSRWRAAYDLAIAQLYIFRLRLYQFLLALDNHANQMPAPKDPASNRWSFSWSRTTIVPDDNQFARLKSTFNLKMTRDEYLKMVVTEEKAATDRLLAVVRDHAGTPWARRAESEISLGFGFTVGEVTWDPRGVRAEAARRVPNF